MALLILPCGAAAQDVSAFYQGRIVELVVGYPPGGSNDLYSRILAEHLGPFIPGKPRIVVRNMPGAGSLKAADYMYNVAPRDGSIIAAVSAGVPLEAKLGNPQARYDPSKFNWIGRIAPSSGVTIVWHTSKINNFEDARKNEVTLGATGAGSTGSLYPKVMNEVLKTKFRLVSGYTGTQTAMLAMERGEVSGTTTTWEAVKTTHPDWVKDGKVRILVQHGLTRNNDMPDVPTSVELTKDPNDRPVMSAIMGASEVGKSFFTAPGVSAERVAALRRAFDNTVRDTKFIEAIEKIQGDIDPMRGEDLQALIGELDNLSDKVIERVKSVYKE